MKYIMLGINHEELGLRTYPIIFPDNLVHSLVAESIKTHEGLEQAVVISAGSCNLHVECFGKSDTLKVKSLEKKDSQAINLYQYTHGMDPEECMPPAVLALLDERLNS